MLPLSLVRIEDLGKGDLVKVDCVARHRIALLTPAALLDLGVGPAAKVLELKRWSVSGLPSAGTSCRGR
ncbi:MAG: hypothetical protein JOY75_19500 [Hyphomicrobiales bacterium]|nr:hypothetical protein [Hyphomicrobiales bacterium]